MDGLCVVGVAGGGFNGQILVAGSQTGGSGGEAFFFLLFLLLWLLLLLLRFWFVPPSPFSSPPPPPGVMLLRFILRFSLRYLSKCIPGDYGLRISTGSCIVHTDLKTDIQREQY